MLRNAQTSPTADSAQPPLAPSLLDATTAANEPRRSKPKKNVRFNAVHPLGEIGDSPAIPPLQKILETADERVRKQSAIALEGLDLCLKLYSLNAPRYLGLPTKGKVRFSNLRIKDFPWTHTYIRKSG